MSYRYLQLSLLSFAALAGQTSFAETTDWNPWRGPDGSGAVESADLPTEWSETKNVAWKSEIPGKGSSTPIILGNKVFVLSAIETDRKDPQASPPADADGGGGRRFSGPPPSNFYQFVVLCFDRTNGKLLWQQVATEEVPHEGGHATNTFASSSPVTDGKYLYVDFGSRGIFCYDLDGKKIWEEKFGKMQTRASFGEGSSPAVYKDTLIVPWDHEGQSFIAALDTATGKQKWSVDRDERTTWSTPLIVEHKGTVQVITNGNTVRSYDLKDGSLIWQCSGQVQNPIPTPVLYGDHVICMTGYQGDAIQSISLDAKGDVSGKSDIAWSRTDAAPYVPSPVLYKGVLYFTKQNNAVISAVNAATGEVFMKPQRLQGIQSVYSSPIAASDRIYFTGRDGTTVVIRHAENVDIIATNTLNETVDSSIAVSGNQLFIRGEKHLFCIANP